MINFFRKYWQNEIVFFSGLFLLILFFFRDAFSIGVFSDDLFFLKISKVHSIQNFLYFFVPGKDYFYRPIPTEVFYSLYHLFGGNILFIRLIVFSVFGIGLIFLYKNIWYLSKNFLLSRIVILIYALSFTHVFQLYYLATFQEIALFTFLSISFYYYLKNIYLLSFLYFIFALMSKETALLYPLFLILYIAFGQSNIMRNKKLLLSLTGYIILAVLFYFISSHGIKEVSQTYIYRIQLTNFRLITNNILWYGLWSIGLPNIMPNYFPSIFGPPLNEFWQLFNNYIFSIYISGLIFCYTFIILNIVIFASYFLKRIYSLKILLFCLASFYCFLLPVLPIIHRWMVRLTLPLIFLSFLLGSIIIVCVNPKKNSQLIVILILSLYGIWNYFGIHFHEETSLYKLETQIQYRAQQYFNRYHSTIIQSSYIYFKDNSQQPLKNSEKLYTSFSDQSFIDFYFPGSKLKAVYNFKQSTIPKNSFVINSIDLLQ